MKQAHTIALRSGLPVNPPGGTDAYQQGLYHARSAQRYYRQHGTWWPKEKRRKRRRKPS